jgi:hypothetical protein
MTILGIDPATKQLNWPKGSPYLLRLQFSDGGPDFADLTGRVLRFAAFQRGGAVVHDEAFTVAGDTATILFPGSVSENPNLNGARWQVAQVFEEGPTPLFRGSIDVSPAASDQGTGAGAPASDLLTWAPATQTLLISSIGARGPSLSEELGMTPEALIEDLVTTPVADKLAEVDGAVAGKVEQVDEAITELGEFTGQRSAEIDDKLTSVDQHLAAKDVVIDAAVSDATSAATLAGEKTALTVQATAAAQKVVDGGATILAAVPVAQTARDQAAGSASEAKTVVATVSAGTRDYVGPSSIKPIFSSNGPDGRRMVLGWDKALGTLVTYVRFKGAEFFNSVSDTPVVQSAARGVRDFVGTGNIPLFTVGLRELFSTGRARQYPLWLGGTWPVAPVSRPLTQWQAQAAKVKTGTGKVRAMFYGNSWAELLTIPQQFANVFRAEFGDAGGGWIAIQGEPPLDTATFVTSAGWTVFDVATSFSIVALPAVGVSHDGKVIYTTATNQTATWTFTGTEFRLFYGKASGAFRYRVDGGAWTTITGDGSNTNGIVTAAGLSAGLHTVEVDTTVNTGTVALYGLYFTTASVGLEVLKCGNGSLHSAHLAAYVNTSVATAIGNLAPDLLVVFMDTNDYPASQSSITTEIAAYTSLVSVVRAVLPNVGFLFVSAADTNLTPVNGTLAQYCDAVGAWCRQNGHAHYNMYDDWSSWAIENARNMWADARHVSAAGAYRIVARLKSFLSL